MGDLRYVLAVLSHGYPYSDTAEETLDSFTEMVEQGPEFVIYHHDGPGWAYDGAQSAVRVGFRAEVFPEGLRGFCTSTRVLWDAASRLAINMRCPYVFWLEHDFRFLRPIDLNVAAARLRLPMVAQVSLMRQPISDREIKAGGVLAAHGPVETVEGAVLHRHYFTTNPSLMRTDFMRANPWPEGDRCEGRFGIHLRERGYQFAVLGDGVTPDVEHIGTLRSGEGY